MKQVIQICTWYSVRSKVGMSDRTGIHSAMYMLRVSDPAFEENKIIWNKDNQKNYTNAENRNKIDQKGLTRLLQWLKEPLPEKLPYNSDVGIRIKAIGLNGEIHQVREFTVLDILNKKDETKDLINQAIDLLERMTSNVPANTLKNDSEAHLFLHDSDRVLELDARYIVDAYLNFADDGANREGKSVASRNLIRNDKIVNFFAGDDLKETESPVTFMADNSDVIERNDSLEEYLAYRLGMQKEVLPDVVSVPTNTEKSGGLFYQKMIYWWVICSHSKLVKYNFLKRNCAVGAYRAMLTGLADCEGKTPITKKSLSFSNFRKNPLVVFSKIAPKEVHDYGLKIYSDVKDGKIRPRLDPIICDKEYIAKVKIYSYQRFKSQLKTGITHSESETLETIKILLKMKDSILNDAKMDTENPRVFAKKLIDLVSIKKIQEEMEKNKSEDATSIIQNLKSGFKSDIRSKVVDHKTALRASKIKEVELKLQPVSAALDKYMKDNRENFDDKSEQEQVAIIQLEEILHSLRALSNTENLSADEKKRLVNKISSNKSALNLKNLPKSYFSVSIYNKINALNTLINATKPIDINRPKEALTSLHEADKEVIIQIIALFRIMGIIPHYCGKYLFKRSQSSNFYPIINLAACCHKFIGEHAKAVDLINSLYSGDALVNELSFASRTEMYLGYTARRALPVGGFSSFYGPSILSALDLSLPF